MFQKHNFFMSYPSYHGFILKAQFPARLTDQLAHLYDVHADGSVYLTQKRCG